jgi:hypothetical protein
MSLLLSCDELTFSVNIVVFIIPIQIPAIELSCAVYTYFYHIAFTADNVPSCVLMHKFVNYNY